MKRSQHITAGLEAVEVMGRDVLSTPLSSRDFCILADAFDAVRVERLVDNGIDRASALLMVGIVSDFFAFETAAKGGE